MRARRSAIALIAFCSAFSPPLIAGAEAAQHRREVKQVRPDAAAHGSKTGYAVPRSENADQPDARLTGSRRGAALAAVLKRRERAQAVVAEKGGISCVPYARMVSGIQVTGDGGTWWGNAAGLYDRGQRPEPGSVLAFRSSRGMSLGHVAVVQRTVSSREIEIEHANWAPPGTLKGQILRNVSVIDVSDRNDWTEVRVEVGSGSGTYGRVYPTYGFIHNRPDGAPGRGTLRYAAGSARYEEVAEAPPLSRSTYVIRSANSRGLDLSVNGANR